MTLRMEATRLRRIEEITSCAQPQDHWNANDEPIFPVYNPTSEELISRRKFQFWSQRDPTGGTLYQNAISHKCLHDIADHLHDVEPVGGFGELDDWVTLERNKGVEVVSQTEGDIQRGEDEHNHRRDEHFLVDNMEWPEPSFRPEKDPHTTEERNEKNTCIKFWLVAVKNK